MLRIAVRVFYALAYSYTIHAHNIVRLADQRFAKFILRHNGKVPAKQPYFIFSSDSLEVCFDRCVAETPCKSINYNDVIKECQHVDYDINDGRDYVIKPGFRHYDTGITSVTRILDVNRNYCITSTGSDPCNFGTPTFVYLYYKPISNPSCTGIEAYFDFDRAAGTLIHLCSGLAVMWDPNKHLALRPLADWTGDYIKKTSWRWRLNSFGYLDNAHQAIYPYGGFSDGSYARMTGYADTSNQNCRMVLDRVAQHPVLFQKMNGSFHGGGFSKFESEFRKKFKNGFHYSTRQSDFWIYPKMGHLYAVRMQALFAPDVTGVYSFWLRGDGWAVLNIGADETPSSRQQIAKLMHHNNQYTLAASGTKFMEH
uniref:Apple domain-containing protein n=2 Tax=Clytia hemisphaerica TaxID=252671 RepID=A0A7M5X5U8_9CNID